MKLISTLLLSLLLCGQTLYGQNVPNGMKYQAVARDLKGQVLAVQDIQLKISLYSQPGDREEAYVELHDIHTNELGLFALSIGEGRVIAGTFEKIPWSTDEIWMEVGVQSKEEADFVTISDSKMLSVPYAFHAATANEIVGHGGDRSPGDPYTKIWNLTGNAQTNPARDKLGTNDLADLVIVTNNTERMRVSQSGDINVVNSLSVGRDLSARRNVYLNTDTIADPHNANYLPAQTINYGDFTVEKNSSTYLTGALTVDGLTRMTNTTQSTLPTNGALVVEGGAGIGKNLNIGGDLGVGGSASFAGIVNFTNTTQSTTKDNGAVIIEGGLGLEKNLNVGGDFGLTGIANFKNTTESTTKDNGAVVIEGGLGVEKNVNIGGDFNVKTSREDFVATFENTDGVTGDGLLIKLGRTAPRWDDQAVPPFNNEVTAQLPGFTFYSSVVMSVKNLFKGLMTSPAQTFSASNFVSILGNLEQAVETETGASLETYASAACNLTRSLILEVNNQLNLPWSFPALNTPVIHVSDAVEVFGGLELPALPDVPSIWIPAIDVPSAPIISSYQVFPQIPAPACPAPPSLSAWSLPNFRLTDVSNSLTNDNEYIQFVDKQDRQVGSIRAESITEWCDRYLDLVYFLNVFNGFAGNYAVGVDPTQIIETLVKFGINGLAEITTLADDYNNIGVEYSSGFGDYAEWLERQDMTEPITPGDIVAIKGGKISRDLKDAEQVMAVSSNPIVLGNTPPASADHKGNKVAFMGQIPVKVMGPVTSGDFIVGKGNIPGYGVAIHPSSMTAEDVERAVGRSWETLPGDGPKLVNTVVGVHNGAFIQVMKQYESRLNANDQRLTAIEKQLGSLLPVASGN